MSFLDRVAELEFLENKWRSGKAELLVLWGKRRVGKTELQTHTSSASSNLSTTTPYGESASLKKSIQAEVSTSTRVMARCGSDAERQDRCPSRVYRAKPVIFHPSRG